jgi:thiamine monophosphate kinase
MDERHENAAEDVRQTVTLFRKGVVAISDITKSPYENIVKDHSDFLMKDLQRIAKAYNLPVNTLVGMAFLDLRLMRSGQ